MTAALTDEEWAFLDRAFDTARDGATEALTGLVRAGLPVDLTTAGGDSLLILAAYHDHPATVAALVDLGADVARVNDRGQTALAAAVFRRSRASVATLLAAGADPAAGPRSALAVAEVFDLPDMLELLLDPDADAGTGDGDGDGDADAAEPPAGRA